MTVSDLTQFHFDQQYHWKSTEPCTNSTVGVECVENGLTATAHVQWSGTIPSLYGTPFVRGEVRMRDVGDRIMMPTDEYPVPGIHEFV